ncbi:MAG: riboflavin synthase [Clostridium perfringens]|nr:riboflavin synthase [Clostridium perfringens]
MFTGIVEEIGEIKKIENGSIAAVLYIGCNKVLEETKLGDSISTNGVCLTVVDILDDGFKADVMAETLRRSSLGQLNVGSKVNLERALTLKKRLGGHIVSGHIDGTGDIVSFEREDNAVWITINAPRDILKYVILKGSIAIDGVSLTVAYVDDKEFKVSIIPHTAEETILLNKNIGSKVNLEYDLIGKYVEKLLFFNKEDNIKKDIDKDFLIENGFL